MTLSTTFKSRAGLVRWPFALILLAVIVGQPTRLNAQAPVVGLSRSTVAPGGTIAVTIANGPGRTTDWVALVPTGAPETTYFNWKYLNGATTPPLTGMTSATVQFVVPLTLGTYEVRLFTNGWTRVGTSGTFTVQNGAVGPAPTLTASPTSVSPGQTFLVNVANGPGTATDWLGLVPVGAADSSYVKWQYLNGAATAPSAGLTSAAVAFAAPTTPGIYDVRLFTAGWNKVATSAPITVSSTATPTLTIGSAAITEANSGSAAATFSVTLSPASSQTVTVAYATANGSASAGSDYVAATGTLTFSPGVTTQTVSVLVNGDTTPEADETFVVRLSTPGNAIIGVADATGTIRNDDVAGAPMLTASPTSVNLGAALSVMLVNGPGLATDWLALALVGAPDSSYVKWQYLNGAATAPATGLTSAALTFAAPTTPGTYEVRLFTGGWNKVATSGPVTVVMVPSLTINSASVTEGHSGSKSLTFTVTATPTSAQTVTVGYATANATAAAGTDYAAASGTLSFAPGEATRTVTVVVNGDTSLEPNETFAVNLTGPTNAVIGSAQGIGTIVNDDVPPAPTVVVSATTVNHGSPIVVTIANGPGKPSDWLALVPAGGADASYVAWRYLNGTATMPATGLTAATVTFTAPTTTGSYDVRLFTDGWTKVATSAQVTVRDTVSPVVSAVAASSVKSAGATIRWTTNEAADTQVDYGTTTAYGATTPLNGGLVTSHSAIVAGLTPETLYHYRVRSRDAAGNLTVSADFTFTTLVEDLVAPTVALTAPGGGVTASRTLTLSSTAADNIAVTGVQFKVDGANVGAEDTVAPYTVAWDTTAAVNGTHTVTAVAWDAAGNQTTSAPVVVTVDNLIGHATLAWDANVGASLAGYKLYVRTASGIYGAPITVGAATTEATVTALQVGRLYYFTVTAYDAEAESGPSNEVSTTIP